MPDPKRNVGEPNDPRLLYPWQTGARWGHERYWPHWLRQGRRTPGQDASGGSEEYRRWVAAGRPVPAPAYGLPSGSEAYRHWTETGRPVPAPAYPLTRTGTAGAYPTAADLTSLGSGELGRDQAQGGTPHGIVQIFNWARNQLAQAQALGELQEDLGRQYEPPDTTTDQGGRGGPGRGSTAPAPPGVDPNWYAQFQREHNGMTPEQYYAQTGEGLEHALADEEWARGFAEMYGRPPTDDDWRAHWFSTRVGYTPEEAENWKRNHPAEEEGEEQRPPTYAPPFIVWR